MIYDQRLEGGIGASRSMGPVSRIEELRHLESVDGYAARHCDSPCTEIKFFHCRVGAGLGHYIWSTQEGCWDARHYRKARRPGRTSYRTTRVGAGAAREHGSRTAGLEVQKFDDPHPRPGMPN